MESSSRFMRALAAVLFMAVCAYCAAPLSRLLSIEPRLFTACSASTDGLIALDGIALRHEQLIIGKSLRADIQDGSRLSAGAVLAQNNSETLSLDSSAVFFEACDGYEYLSPDMLGDLTVSSFSGILKCKPKSERNVLGRLVTANDWYFAALCPEDAALSTGDICLLRFENSRRLISGRIHHLSAAQGGKRALLLRFTAGYRSLLSLRFCRAELFSTGRTGIKFPASALKYDAYGNSFVNILHNGEELSRRVDIIYSDPGGQWHLSSESAESGFLQEGDSVICSASQIFLKEG